MFRSFFDMSKSQNRDNRTLEEGAGSALVPSGRTTTPMDLVSPLGRVRPQTQVSTRRPGTGARRFLDLEAAEEQQPPSRVRPRPASLNLPTRERKETKTRSLQRHTGKKLADDFLVRKADELFETAMQTALYYDYNPVNTGVLSIVEDTEVFSSFLFWVFVSCLSRPCSCFLCVSCVIFRVSSLSYRKLIFRQWRKPGPSTKKQ